MLFFPEFMAEKNNPEKKQINGNPYPVVVFDLFPCFFHPFAPVNIIKDDNRFSMGFIKHLPEILKGWSLCMIAIDKSKVNFINLI